MSFMYMNEEETMPNIITHPAFMAVPGNIYHSSYEAMQSNQPTQPSCDALCTHEGSVIAIIVLGVMVFCVLVFAAVKYFENF